MRTIHHTPDCQAEDVHEVTGNLGDTLARCTNCRRFVVVLDETEPAQEPRRAPARLVCREHHDQPVNARGKGCTQCPRRRERARPEPPAEWLP